LFNQFNLFLNFFYLISSFMKNIRLKIVLISLAFFVILASCKKDDQTIPPPQEPLARKILLKDIVMPHLPSPYYHFEYNNDSVCVKANFASGYTIYDILYSGDKIREMRNNIIVNHDTLRYIYDNTGKLSLIKFINQENVNYRQAKFTFDGSSINNIEWDLLSNTGDITIDRRLSFEFYPDRNVKSIEDHRYPHAGLPESINITTYEGYDRKINVDDFSLVHDGIHDHLFLLQGFRLQKGNPAKETLVTNGVKYYTVDYNYSYNPDGTPSIKNGSLLFYSGTDSGKVFNVQTQYSYY